MSKRPLQRLQTAAQSLAHNKKSTHPHTHTPVQLSAKARLCTSMRQLQAGQAMVVVLSCLGTLSAVPPGRIEHMIGCIVHVLRVAPSWCPMPHRKSTTSLRHLCVGSGALLKPIQMHCSMCVRLLHV